MSETTPSLSVVIPVYNAERYVADAVQSILSERYPSLEIIAVDDGSTDRSAEVVRTFPQVAYHYQYNQGPAAARNHGLRLANGEFILFLDADDLFPEGKIRNQLRHFDESPELDIVLGKSQFFFENEADKSLFRFPDESYQVISTLMGCGIYRRRVFEKVGMFDESLRFSEDFDWFNRIRELNISIKVLDDVTLLYRRHHTNMTHEMDQVKLRTLEMIKRSLDRRRQEGEVKQLRTFSEFK